MIGFYVSTPLLPACIFSSFLHIMTLVCTLVVFESYPIAKYVTAALKAYTQ
jgi:hypothetical protein